MAVDNNRGLTLDRKSTKGARGVSLRPVGQRFANFLRGTSDNDERPGGPQPPRWLEQAELLPVGEELPPRFAVVRHGYDCTAVDTHVTELERELSEVDRELAELRTQSASREEVADEIKRVGEQTSAVLIAANEQREEILRGAQAQADRCVEEATGRASAITAESEVRLRELQVRYEAAQQEHDRLLEEVRNLSVALAALADRGPEAIEPQAQQAGAQPGADESPHHP